MKKYGFDFNLEEEINKLRCIHLADRHGGDKLCKALEMVKEQQKVIELMTDDLLHYNEYQVNLELLTATANGDTVQDYYFKKARGEEDV